ncbi:hypothetical protein A374_00689 [Fictibacillus macauensis ZFHKF-1]|uniref:ATPase n=1 Tax=Fictibacillus macauensis ZFHKF-1 TaxID=1196324 RepID=I8UKI9_9BACL|nr:PRK06851 family protein [Fictibacillus macauensis]EIT87343.1 hypothetical protein A374_00689 [Fictibacillus macauensis ZFHKF-1]
MTGTVRNYFAGGNTAYGFYSYFENNLQDLQRLFILKGGPGTGKSTLMEQLGVRFEQQGYDVDYIHCASDNGSIDGVIFPQIQVGIVDGTAPHVIEPTLPGIKEEYVNLGEAWDRASLLQHREEISRFVQENQRGYECAYAAFNEALHIHDQWEGIYIDNMDFTKADIVMKTIAQRFFSHKLEKTSKRVDRYLGAATPNGAVDFVPNLTEDVPTRLFIKGRPGSGKSTMLKALTEKAMSAGYDVEVYHCGFDYNSLDMIIAREAGFAIFDSTAPHEYFPSRDGDEIIDMYAAAITPGTDERYQDEITHYSEQYREKMNEAIAHLGSAKKAHDGLEALYMMAMDYEKVDQITENIALEIAAAFHQLKS